MYYLGTDLGNSLWSNPVIDNKAYIFYYAPSGGSVTPSKYVDRDVLQNFFIGLNGYFVIDVGIYAGSEFSLRSYSLQNHPYPDRAARTFKVFGSNDLSSNSVSGAAAATWTLIDDRVNDTSMPAGANAWGFYTLPQQSDFFRWFKFQITGGSSSGSTDYYFCVSEVELYGTSRILKK